MTRWDVVSRVLQTSLIQLIIGPNVDLHLCAIT